MQYIKQKLTEEQQTQARANIGAADAEEVCKLSEDIEDLKQNGTGGSGSGFTSTFKTALLNFCKICAVGVDNGQDYINALESAMKVTANETQSGISQNGNVLSISENANATASQNGNVLQLS